MPETPSLGADELEIRDRLRKLEVGPDAGPPTTIPPKPTTQPRDWLDDILDDNSTAPKPVEVEPEPLDPEPPVAEPQPPKADPKPATQKPQATAKARRKKPRRPNPHTPRSAWDTQPRDPRQSLVEAWDAVPYRLKWLAYHATAAYLGWTIGLVSWVTYVTAWIADGHLTSPQSVFWYVAAALTFLLYRRTRGMWLPVAWLAAVPAASTVVGVLLHGTPHP
jgi:hypothetical protein